MKGIVMNAFSKPEAIAIATNELGMFHLPPVQVPDRWSSRRSRGR